MLSTSCWTRRQIVKILKCPSSVQYCPLNNLSFPLQVKPNTLFQWQVYSGPSVHLKLNLRKCDMQYPVRMALSWEFWSWKFRPPDQNFRWKIWSATVKIDPGWRRSFYAFFLEQNTTRPAVQQRAALATLNASGEVLSYCSGRPSQSRYRSN